MMKTCKILMVMMIPMGVYGQSSVHSSWGEGTGTGGRMTYSMGQVFVQNVKEICLDDIRFNLGEVI